MRHQTDTATISNARQTLASVCPGCGLPVLFDPAELECDEPALHDVMCAFCGTVTSKWLLSSQAYDPRRAATLRHRG
jgi:hypothetical protein